MNYTTEINSEGKLSAIRCPEGEISVLPAPNPASDPASNHRQRRRVELHPSDPHLYIPRRAIDTTYPDELLLAVLDTSNFAWLCDVIARDDDSTAIQKALFQSVFGFVSREKFAGKRLLDLGCGSGSSSAVLARALPDTEIVGVELNARLLKLAALKISYQGLKNVRFEASPCGTRLPENIGTFDYIVFSAVFEHLLPKERVELMPHVWAALRPGGVLFINQTPHRYFPVDTHSSGLPLVNYLPDSLAHWAVRRFSRRGAINQSLNWEEHLRGGLRGATEREILRTLRADDHSRPEILQPCAPETKDRIDLWFTGLSPKHRPVKQALRLILKVVYRLTGSVVTPNLAVAIQKS
jgi:2-polyprenyl-3-methyl-5-hydroxy-6-metoxy-1,4-benzoquinol methylase